jgi:hypothetical protein
MKPLVVYTLLRLGLFALVFGVLLATGAEFWLAAIIAAVFGLAFSYLFLRKRRDELVTELQARREHGIASDEEAEDSER